MVGHLPVRAFMKVARDLLIILKNGSRTGNLSEPHSTVCSRMWGTPVLSRGVVLNATLKTVVNTLFIEISMTCLLNHQILK